MKNLDAEILDMVKETEIAEEIAQADGYKDEVYAALVKIERALKEHVAALPGIAPATTPGPLPVTTTRAGSHVKLP